MIPGITAGWCVIQTIGLAIIMILIIIIIIIIIITNVTVTTLCTTTYGTWYIEPGIDSSATFMAVHYLHLL